MGSFMSDDPNSESRANWPRFPQAIDYFYTDATAQANASSSKTAASNDKKIGQVWDKYKGAYCSRFRV